MTAFALWKFSTIKPAYDLIVLFFNMYSSAFYTDSTRKRTASIPPRFAHDVGLVFWVVAHRDTRRDRELPVPPVLGPGHLA
ncbi:hypothetical protein GGS24DRAFT_505156 [Hypoxylon argillaceum]|nr:hypothetical protein GGS24DRAFT_505156 [Hypoxylon argillaceum]